MRSSEAVRPLIEKLRVRDDKAVPSLVDAVTEALEAIGPPSVEPLCEVLSDRDELFRARAVEVLGKIRDARAVRPLLNVLQDDPSVIVLPRASEALGNIGAAAVAPLFVFLSEQQNKWPLEYAQQAVRNVKDPEAVGGLTRVLIDQRSARRDLAAEMLGAIDRKSVV